jgi:flagellar biosynthetic protein FliO
LVSFTLFLPNVFAAESTNNQQTASVQVGSSITPTTDALSVIIALFFVLSIIVVAAMVLKRFNLVQTPSSQLSVVATLPLSTKERLMVIQVGEQQLLLGVTAQQITHLATLAQPIAPNKPLSEGLNAQLKKWVTKHHD